PANSMVRCLVPPISSRLANPDLATQLARDLLMYPSTSCGHDWSRCSLGGLGRHREGRGPLRIDGSDLVKQTAVQTRVSCGNLRRLLEAAGHDEPVAADDFLGFAKRTVRHAFPGNRFSCGRESLSGLHLSLSNKPA